MPLTAESMQAVQIVQYHRPFQLCRCAIPRPKAGEVLVEVKASGLCSTDLHLLDGRQDLGKLPRIPGHENAGVIAELGPGVASWRTGQRVVVVIDVTCGHCRHCLNGQTQRCPKLKRIGFERDGGHAGYVAVPVQNLIELPDALSFEDACILPDATACMYHSLVTQGKIGPNQKVLILGAGGLGMHGIQIARLAGAEVAATSRRTHRLKEAARLGAVSINPEETDLSEAIREFAGSEGLDLVADCIGTQDSIARGFALLRPGGKLLVIAYLDKAFEFPSLPLFSKEKEIIGCRGTNKLELREVVELVARGRLRSIIGATFPLSEFIQATETLGRGETVGRIVITR
jgi:2-desacetyl-2-hydroxyethyl bacteriochlorophyllide A dehydrogenase